MRQKIKICIVLLAAILLLDGCALRTLDQLYCPPKRSEDRDNLQSVIDKAMNNLTYCAPISGQNLQAVQNADLDGDGVDEYLLFAKDDSENPLKILIFRQVASGYVLMDTIEGYGFAFDSVEYAQLDDRDGMEIIVSRRVSDGVSRSVAVYRFTSDFARQLLLTAYSGMAVCDFDQNGIHEMIILGAGASEFSKGLAHCYSYGENEMERVDTIYLSQPISSLQQVEIGQLEDGTPAVFATSSVNDSTMTVDVLIVSDNSIVNLSNGFSIPAVNNYQLYPTDIDEDGAIELPSPVEIPTPSEQDEEYIMQWHAIDRDGNIQIKARTYHHYSNGWYLCLDDLWELSLAVERMEDGCAFYRLDPETGEPVKLFTIYTFTGSDREQLAAEAGRLLLYRSENLIYAADLEKAFALLEFTKEDLLEFFIPIRQEWTNDESGETK